jgi:urease accessory protein
MIPREPVDLAQWHARLALDYARRGTRTVLARREHSGPLAVQKPFYPEGDGVCHQVLLHPPAGLAGGDRLEILVHAEPGSHALLTTPGAGKWYRSAGAEAGQSLDFQVAAGASLEWLPQETIVFDGALARMHTEVTLAGGARYLGWEIICLGRTASGERFARGRLGLCTRIRRAGAPIWWEQGTLHGGSPALDAPAVLAGQPVFATLLLAADGIGTDVVNECRAVEAEESDALTGLTALPQLLVARYLGGSAEAARRYLEALRQRLRPAVWQRDAVAPRIWNT